MSLKISGILFILAGTGVIFSLFWLDGAGFSVWLLAKILYFVGVVFFIFKK
ncbi:MAG: hypothetical protein HY505_02905 [Candidatus Yanofskybacteria bacterium]|nr:hypothetical protein [Candidatus Yanofskybacteria bacterium]